MRTKRTEDAPAGSTATATPLVLVPAHFGLSTSVQLRPTIASSDRLAPVFDVKLHVPVAGAHEVVRDRLLPLLDRAADGRTVVVRGPVGSGKTRAVAQWVRGRPDRQVAWVTLDRADRDPARFLRYVLAAARRTPAGSTAFAGLAPLPPGVAVTEEYLGEWQRAADALDAPVVLVLDGLEHVARTATATLVARLATHLPGTLGMILVGRDVPDLPLARLELEGRVTEIGSTDLAVTVDELHACLRAAGVTLDEEDVARLHRTTGGWCVGVALAVVALRGSPDPAQVSQAIAGTDRRLHDYLLAEVFEGQTADRQEFLLAASVSDQVCPALADALTGSRGGSVQLLAELEREQVFLSRSAGDGSWYRWHPLFAAFLRGRLHESAPDQERDLHRAAGRWWHEQGSSAPAVHHLLMGRDVDGAVAALGASWLDLVIAGEVSTVRAMLGALTEEVCWQTPEAAVATAYVHLLDGEPGHARTWARRAVEAPGPPGGARRRAVAETAAVVRLRCASLDGDADGLRVRASALRLLEADAPTRPERVRRALLEHYLGAFDNVMAIGGRDHLTAALAESRALGLTALALRARAELVLHEGHEDGDVTAARERAAEVLAAAESRGWGGDGALAGLHLYAAHLALLQADAGAALRHVERAEALVPAVDLVHRCWIALVTARAMRSAGGLRSAAEAVQRLRSVLAEWSAAPDWAVVVLHVALAEQALAEHLPTRSTPVAAAEVLARLPVPVPEGPIEALYATTLALTRLRCGDPAGARRLVAAWSGPETAVTERVTALVVDALATDALGGRDAALATLDLALHLAGHGRGLLGPLVSAGPEVHGLLTALLDRGTGHDDLATDALRLLSAGPRPVGGRGATLYVEPLSPREVDVLRLVQGTASNAEVAGQLFISLNTLRSHLKAINRKLGTTDRRAAVRRARELGLI